MSGVETPEFAAMVCRQVRALGRRVGDADPVDLVELVRVRGELDEALRAAVGAQRERYSWGEIAEGLGVSRQSAHERFSPGVTATAGS